MNLNELNELSSEVISVRATEFGAVDLRLASGELIRLSAWLSRDEGGSITPSIQPRMIERSGTQHYIKQTRDKRYPYFLMFGKKTLGKYADYRKALADLTEAMSRVANEKHSFDRNWLPKGETGGVSMKIDEVLRNAVKEMILRHRSEYEDLVHSMAKEAGIVSDVPFQRSFDIKSIPGLRAVPDIEE